MNSSMTIGRRMFNKAGAWLALAVTVAAMATPKAEAGAVATDSRNCAWGTASVYEGSASLICLMCPQPTSASIGMERAKPTSWRTAPRS